ncbi:MAG: hypothetical protein SRB2_00346 [Desulfobacteraceae bacterium Eth-SRB2]|nr:MAG: hypothetical protein SRB2_00346 [Desulfobacteraceae bacterium Eth-SRB2]
MKKFISNHKLIGSLKWGFFLGVVAIFIISPLCSDAIDEIPADSLFANDLCIEKDTLIKDPATGQKIPFSQLKSGNPKLSSSLNQLLSAYQFGGEPRMNALAKEKSIKLNKDLIQVVIEVTADTRQPLAQEILEDLKLRILEVGGEFELDFNNLLQVLLPVHALEEVANWPEIKFIREPFRPHPIKNGPATGDQSKAGVFKLYSSIQADEGNEAEIPIESFQKKFSEDPTKQQGCPIEVQALKDSFDNTICLKKKIEKFSPDPSSYEQIPDEKQRDNENSLEEDRYLKGETLVSAQAYSEVWFCLEYNCSSVTVTFGGRTHSLTLKCSNPIGFGNVPDGTYSYYASGCGVNWGGTITVSGANQRKILCPPPNDSDCCPNGCGDGGSHLCGQCGELTTPNLTPYKPSGWSDKIVVSTNSGDHLDDSPLYDTDTLYIDFAVDNDGTAPTDQTYYIALYIDDVIKLALHKDPPHSPGLYGKIEDYLIGSLSAGTHTIKLVADYDNRIAESNETDNEYTKTITVLYDPSNQPVTSEGVSLIGADKWQDDGYTGEGIKIAIIDGGFKNYSSLLGRELPGSVTTKFYGSDEDVNGSEHGTACAEIIYDIAPDAQFFLTQPRTEVELGNAVNWCIGQGVQIISYSIGWSINSGPLDGTGPINDTVNQAVNHGITWVNSSGNYAKAHWGGDFYDPDGDGFANFSGTDKTNNFLTAGGKNVAIGMNWDDPWGSSSNDYDLYVYDLSDPSNPVAFGANIQDGDDNPGEFLNFTPQSGASYGFAINKKSGISKNIHVTLNSQNPLQYQVPATSILIPADNPNVITVGAVAWNTPSEIEDFSSQGPTTDGRIKPDLVAPDKVSTSSFTYGAYPGGFPGTSASCPHVAGACALVKQACPAWSHSQIKNYLEQNAADLGTTGKDNIYGSGLINLPALPPSCSFKNLYFPHIASNSTWETEICVINTSAVQSLTGNLRAYNDSGQEVSSTPVILAANARRQIVIGDELPNPSGIGYIIFESDSENVCGYTKFYIEGKYRVAVPAVSDINTGDIYLSHIASNTSWWTGVSLLNTTSSSKQLTIEFDNGTTKPITIAAKAHQAFTINSLFGGVLQPNINSAVIKNGSGIVGLELFGSSDSSGDNYLSGILLKDNTTTHIYYPHIASNSTWWTGIVAYNPAVTSCTLTITPFSEDGTSLTPQTITLAGKEKYIGTAQSLYFPDGTAWFRIVASNPITGFELFGTTDGNQLGGYTGVGISGTDGVFAKTEKDGWTGIAFVNIENAPAIVAMTAYNDSGNVIATESLNIAAYEKVVNVAPNLFSQDISNTTYIGYSSDGEVVGFQLNGSSDNMMLDALPGM